MAAAEWDEMELLSQDPAVIELAGINADMQALQDRVETFLEGHRAPGHTCPCCTALEARMYPSGVNVWDYLVSVRFALWSTASHLDSERPFAAGEWEARHDRIRRIVEDHDAAKAAQEETVTPDAVAEATIVME